MRTSSKRSPRLRKLVSTLLLAPLLTATLAAGGKEPVPVAPATVQPEDSGWEFSIAPYGWLLGINGTTGVGDMLTDIDISPMDILSHVDFFFFLQAEAHRGKWGLLFDGYYAELSGGGTPPGPLYSQLDFTLSQAQIELAISYRILEGQAGYVDVIGGARYNSMELELNAFPSEGGVKDFSENVSSRLIDEVADRARKAIASRSAAIKSSVAGQVASIKEDLIDQIGGGGGLGPIGSEGAVRDYVRALVDAQVAALRAEARGRAKSRLAAAEKKLAAKIEKQLRENLPRSATGKKEWVDPFIGFRARWNLTEKLFLIGRGDVGGFGVGSDLTWQATAAFGWQLSDSWSMELGYRYMDIDYTDGNFVYDAVQDGIFTSLTYRF